MHDDDASPESGLSDDFRDDSLSDDRHDGGSSDDFRDLGAAEETLDSAALAGEPADDAMPVDIGSALPPAAPVALPVLQQAAPAMVGALGRDVSIVADGMHFTGNATLSGSCSVSGAIEGHLRQAADASVSVVVTESGRVRGDITAHRISVMGHTEGILDAGAGEVSLHEGSHVQGMVRYGRIQVSGADLNATLERVTA